MQWKHIARWAARVLSILLILFFLMFSFDEPILSLGFLMHNVPTAIILILAIIAWKYERAGGIVYILLGIAAMIFFNVRELIQGLLVVLPFIVIGVLYLLSSSAPKPNPKPHS
jgi:hypothetical protein